jgi:hypothetical protein
MVTYTTPKPFETHVQMIEQLVSAPKYVSNSCTEKPALEREIHRPLVCNDDENHDGRRGGSGGGGDDHDDDENNNNQKNKSQKPPSIISTVHRHHTITPEFGLVDKLLHRRNAKKKLLQECQSKAATQNTSQITSQNLK